MMKNINTISFLLGCLFCPHLASGQIQLKPGESFIVVEEMPYFPGCDAASNKERRNCSKQVLSEFIAKIIKPLASNQQDSLDLLVQFIVEKDGSISEVKLTRGDVVFEESIKKAMEAMPKWVPGKQRGIVTRVMYRMPLKIGLD